MCYKATKKVAATNAVAFAFLTKMSYACAVDTGNRLAEMLCCVSPFHSFFFSSPRRLPISQAFVLEWIPKGR